MPLATGAACLDATPRLLGPAHGLPPLAWTCPPPLLPTSPVSCRLMKQERSALVRALQSGYQPGDLHTNAPRQRSGLPMPLPTVTRHRCHCAYSANGAAAAAGAAYTRGLDAAAERRSRCTAHVKPSNQQCTDSWCTGPGEQGSRCEGEVQTVAAHLYHHGSVAWQTHSSQCNRNGVKHASKASSTLQKQ